MGISMFGCLAKRAPPFLDMPEELLMDVNKAPHPIANIIMDQPSILSEQASTLKAHRAQERVKLALFKKWRDAYNHRASENLKGGESRLKRLTDLKAMLQARTMT